MPKEIRNPDCTKCSLSTGCAWVCEVLEPDTEYPIMVIGDYPTNPDEFELRPLSDSKFDLFWKIANEVVGIGNQNKMATADTNCRNDVYATYATKCKPKQGDKPTEQQNITCASAYLRKEIQRVKPKAILLLGALPAMAFGFTDPMSKLRGTTKEIKLKDFTTTLVVAHSPSYIQYNSNELKNFALDINKAWQIANGVDVSVKRSSPTKVTMCTTIEQVEQLIVYIQQVGECTFDFETTKLEDMGVFAPDFKATLVAFSFQHGSAYTIPLEHFESPFTRAEVDYIFSRLSKEIWANSVIHKINQNIKFDMHVAARYGYPVFSGRLDCTMVMHSLYDDLTKHGIKEWLPMWFPEFDGWELVVKGQAWDKIPLKTLSQYAGVDADGAYRGFTVLESKLLEDDRVYDLYRNLYTFALKPLYNMERRGMLMSRENLLKYEARALELIEQQTAKLNVYEQVQNFIDSEREKQTEEKLIELREKKAKAKEGSKLRLKYSQQIGAIKAGIIDVYEGVNYGSPQQLNDLLYNKEGFGFKVPYDKKTRGNKRSTGEVIVKGLNDNTGFINDLLILRSLQGTYSKYLYGLRMMLDADDYIHTTYNQARVKTGRLSSGGVNAGVNLQNIVSHVKIKNDFVEELTAYPKKCFIVSAGYALMNLDFSQAELRMMAEYAQEDKMIAAYNSGKDLHILTACAISNVTEEEFMLLPEKERDQLRQKAKSANFGLIYGQSAAGFQEYAENKYGVTMSLGEATRVRDTFFITYPKILDYHATYIAKGKKFSFVRTIFGRRAHYPDIDSRDDFLRGNAERELVNMPIQGSNGENTVFALALLEQRLPKSVLILNSVHDSIMLSVPYKHVSYVVKLGVDTCEKTPMKRFFGREMVHLGMKADVQISLTSWKDLKKYNEAEWLSLNLK